MALTAEPLDLQAERTDPTGNCAPLGPSTLLDHLARCPIKLLVCSAAQNAWDAKRPDAEAVTFGMALHPLTPPELTVLHQQVLATTPGDPEQLHARLLATAPHTPLHALSIYDRGTTGLGGPTRADAPADSHEARDFIDFLRNIGQPPDKSRGGGTFGYGKAALYLSSQVDTILVHTRCRVGARLESRFMVSALTPHYELEGRRYTGRHWWGRRGADGVVDPVLGAEADALARGLGMPAAPAGECGTTIMILAPRLDGREPGQAMAYIQAQMLWNFWPKMIPWEGEEGPRMRFETRLNGERLPLPSPTEVAPLKGFVRALKAVRRADAGGESEGVTTLLCGNPKQKLGLLDIQYMVHVDPPELDYGEDTELPEFVDRCHHIALLRRAELVIAYHPGPPLPNHHVEYAGVFLADDEMDRIFASSEPPTHDEWRPENLADRRHKTFVRTTFRRLNARTREFIAPKVTGYASEDDRPLAALSAHLGHLLIDAGAHAAGLPMMPKAGAAGPPGAGGGEGQPPERVRRQARPKLSLEPRVELLDEDGALVRLFRAQLVHAKGGARTRLRARAFTIVAGGGEEREAPAGAGQPYVASWRAPGGREADAGEAVIAEAEDEGVWEIRVRGGEDSLVGLDLSAELPS